jgi:hypothetical protein
MDSGAFNALFERFTRSAFRLETLPAYAVSAEDARLRAFREGAPRPERSVRTDPWLARIALTTIRDGKSWSRVHLIRHPLTEYLRFELVSYTESQAVGEQVGLVDLDEHPELAESGPDFWLFDWDTDQPFATLMHYTEDGRVDRRELVTEPERVAELDERRRQVTEVAVPLNVYLARRGG